MLSMLPAVRFEKSCEIFYRVCRLSLPLKITRLARISKCAKKNFQASDFFPLTFYNPLVLYRKDEKDVDRYKDEDNIDGTPWGLFNAYERRFLQMLYILYI